MNTKNSKDATEITAKTNTQVIKELPFADEQDFEDAKCGFIAPLPNTGVIKNSKGETVWDMNRFSFIKQDAPAPNTVNPSLWRQSQLLMLGGLYKVVDGLYQVRNADISNMVIIEGKNGIIIADPLVSKEVASAALDLYYQHRPKKPVVAVIYSHSHVDHWGGVRGVVSEDDFKAGKVKIYAPEGFLEAAISENILAGTAMNRRAQYMYGSLLPASPNGQVGAGLGMTASSGNITLIPPTNFITKTGQKENIAGLDFEFLLAPDTEAPAEMHWYIEQLKAVTAAENCVHTMHNTYTLRGAKIRDPLAWSKYLDETMAIWGEKAEVMYGFHHWPVWGKKRVLEMLKTARDGYRYINDQTLRLANHGYTMLEIGEMIELPTGLAQHWSIRPYYGSMSHNAKATYVKYLGWFDANPANLNVLPPVEASKKYVEFMGGADATLKKARAAFDKGEYRWVAEVVNRVVFADPKNEDARELQADVLEQLGYQAENGTWRNFYLTGAKELREGVNPFQIPITTTPDSIRAMTLDMFFDYLGVRLNGPKAADKNITLNFDFTDTKEKYVLSLRNGVLNHRPQTQVEDADASIITTRAELNKWILGESTMDQEIKSGAVKIEGKMEVLGELLALMDTFNVWFNIVTP
jgi:alkyl sulfatase BDS1-like metallo-beta-lactamase superfamily hydrolase